MWTGTGDSSLASTQGDPTGDVALPGEGGRGLVPLDLRAEPGPCSALSRISQSFLNQGPGFSFGTRP